MTRAKRSLDLSDGSVSPASPSGPPTSAASAVQPRGGSGGRFARAGDRPDSRALESLVKEHYRQGTDGDVLGTVLATLKAAGKDIEALAYEDLAGLDHLHAGGLSATRSLAALAGFSGGERVLDMGGGFGGPARTLAAEFGCRVAVLDLTEAFVRAGKALTRRLGLQEAVSFHLGSSLEAPFPDGSFDVVWMQNAGMNIADKARLAAEQARVLRPGGWLVFQEVLAGPGGAVLYPAPWARDPAVSFLVPPEHLRETLRSAGFEERAWEDVSTEAQAVRGTLGVRAGALVYGSDYAEMNAAMLRNEAERRVLNVRAVFQNQS